MNQRISDARWLVKNLGPCPACEPGHVELAELAQCLFRRRLERGTLLFAEGKTPEGVWVLIEGAVELAVKAGRARRVIQIVRAGDSVGDPYLLLDLAPPCTARTVEETHCLFVPADNFLQLISRHPSLCALWLYNLASRVVQGRTRLMEVLANSLGERVARVLVEESHEGILRLPQKTLAEMLGVQRTSVNKVLRSFEAEGLIELSYGRIVVKDQQRLMLVASSGDKVLASFLLHVKNDKDDAAADR